MTSRFTKGAGTKHSKLRSALASVHNHGANREDGIHDASGNFSRTDSQERINRVYDGPLKIYQHQEIHISSTHTTLDRKGGSSHNGDDGSSMSSAGIETAVRSPVRDDVSERSVTIPGTPAGVITMCERF